LLTGLRRIQSQRGRHLSPRQSEPTRGEQQPGLKLVDLRPCRRQQLERRHHRISHLPVDIRGRTERRRTRPPQKELNQINRRRRHRTNLPRSPLELISPSRQQQLPSLPLPLRLHLITRRLIPTVIALHPETVHHQQSVVNIPLKLGRESADERAQFPGKAAGEPAGSHENRRRTPLIIRLADATPENAGAKAAVLGRLLRAGFPVPPGFVIPIDAYRAVTAHLDLTKALSSRNPDEARHLVEAQPVPPWLLDELAEALTELGDHPVAVRSSATTEDTPTASAAGQHDTYLGLHGLPAITTKLQATWASLWTQRAITYRQLAPTQAPTSTQAQASTSAPARAPAQARTEACARPQAAAPAALEPGIAVIVQRHLDADVAGVLFTADPRSPGGAAVIEASWGLGESVVQGVVTPDTYTVGGDGRIRRQCGAKLSRRDRTAGADGVVVSEVPVGQRGQLCLSDGQVQQIIQLGREIADRLGSPQDIEFAVEGGRVWILQSRAITAPLESVDGAERESGVLRGVGGSPGVATGPARVVEGVGDFGRVEKGDILVCRFTDPAWTPLFGVVAGVVTEVGGRLSHAAIVAREHRIPAVLGVPGVMSAVADGQLITIVGTTGSVSAQGLLQ
jgi:pyruvate,water dikinase